MISSPMNLSTVPPYFSTTGTRCLKQLFIRLRTLSGSMPSDMAVNPDRSANITVTMRRSASISSDAVAASEGPSPAS